MLCQKPNVELLDRPVQKRFKRKNPCFPVLPRWIISSFILMVLHVVLLWKRVDRSEKGVKRGRDGEDTLSRRGRTRRSTKTDLMVFWTIHYRKVTSSLASFISLVTLSFQICPDPELGRKGLALKILPEGRRKWFTADFSGHFQLSLP